MAYWGLLFNALIWGVSWWPLRQLQARGLHPVWSTCLFFLVGGVLMVLLRPRALNQFWRSPLLVWLAVVAGATNAAFNWGVTTGDVVRVVLLFYLMPLWAVLFARWFLKEPVTRLAWARVGVALAGAALVIHPDPAHWLEGMGLADALGVLGGVGFAWTNVLLRKSADQSASARALAMFVGGTLLPGVLGAVMSQSGAVPWPAANAAWLGLGLIMGAVFFLANLALQFGTAHLPVQRASLIMLTEVLFAAASAVWLGAAQLTAQTLIGGALVMSAALMAAWDER